MTNRNAMDEQQDLFGRRSVHELVEAHTSRELLRAASNHIKEPGRNNTLDILSGRRGSRTILSAALRAEKAAELLLGDGDQPADLRSYAYAAWAHAGLPRRDLQDATARWTVSTDYATLTVSPGTRRLTEGSEALPIGVPFGSYARLVLLDWQSEAIRNKSRHVHIGKSPSAALKRMELPHGSEAMRMLQEQTERLAVCTIAFSLENGGRGLYLNQPVVEAAEYSYGRGNKRFIESVLLNQGYYEQLLRNPVVLDPSAIVQLRDSPTALDIYTWLAWRLPALRQDTKIGWTALKAQLGGGATLMKNFKPHFRPSLLAAHAVYADARLELTDDGLILRPSPPPMPRQRLITVG
jgi:Plasmid encoded RepA protein